MAAAKKKVVVVKKETVSPSLFSYGLDGDISSLNSDAIFKSVDKLLEMAEAYGENEIVVYELKRVGLYKLGGFQRAGD